MSRLRFVAGETETFVDFPRRDFNILLGPESLIDGGGALVHLLGVFDNFDVAAGESRSPEMTRPRLDVLSAVQRVGRSVARDVELLAFDYSYSFSSAPKQRNGGAESGFRIAGQVAKVDTRPKGFCTVTVHGAAGAPTRLLDLRAIGSLITDDNGSLRCHRRAAELGLPSILRRLENFLVSSQPSTVTIFNR